MKDALANMPLFLSKAQQTALCRMDTPEDAQIVAAMLESIGTNATATLPIGSAHQHTLPQTRPPAVDSTPLLWINPK
jgi:hypothetical protein